MTMQLTPTTLDRTPARAPDAPDGLAYRGDGRGRPAEVIVPTSGAPMLRGGVLRKHWRFAGVWGPELSVCAATVKAGPFSHEFWAVWLRGERRLVERTRLASRAVDVTAERLCVRDGDVDIDLELIPRPESTMEVVTPAGDAWTWTRKRVIRAVGAVRVAGERHDVEVETAMLEENGGYHPRRTAWRWAAGAGRLDDGRSVMWNAVVGLNDRPPLHENTVWVDGVPHQTGLVAISRDLSRTDFGDGCLHFHCEADRTNTTDLVLMKSHYRAPLGTFSGTLPGGLRLAEGHGVMEDHRALW